MERVESLETTDEVMKNRLIIRRYLRELITNQKRLAEKLQEQGILDSQGKPIQK